MGRVEGKVALITGAARGQGRAHAVRLAEQGADIVALDICRPLDEIDYPLGTEADLEETAELVSETGQAVVTGIADVRDQQAVDKVVQDALARFGRIDVVCSNAGLVGYQDLWGIDEDQFQTVVGTNLTGHWHVMKSVVPSMIERGQGGSIIAIGSAVSTKAISHAAHYVASKHGLVGLVRAAALELATHRIRVNMVNPGGVATQMVDNEGTRRLFCPDVEDPTMEDMARAASAIHPMGVPFLETDDISNAVVYLASDEARYVTGAMLAVDLGMAIG